MPDLNSLLLFAKVADAGSFSEAARRLRMPVSTLSRRIAELEESLGIRLLERSTRNLRLSELGTEVLEQARRATDLNDTLDAIVSDRASRVSGTIRLSAPPSISDTLLAPIACTFQTSYPDIRIQVLVTDRRVDHVTEGVDVAFRLGARKEPSLVIRRMLTYRHKLVASPAYLANRRPPATPQDLHEHALVAFTHWQSNNAWTFVHTESQVRETIDVQPRLAMNDYAGIASVLVCAGGIGDLPPLVQPDLLRSGQLVEVMPGWRFRAADLSAVHLGGPNVTRPVRLFTDYATRIAPTLFPDLPI